MGTLVKFGRVYGLGKLLDLHVKRKPAGPFCSLQPGFPFAWHVQRQTANLLTSESPALQPCASDYFLKETQGFAYYVESRGSSTQGPTQRPQDTLVHIPLPSYCKGGVCTCTWHTFLLESLC